MSNKPVYGNMGKILRVNLTKGTYKTEDSTPYMKEWLGRTIPIQYAAV